MLYIFRVDTGSMMTLEMSLALETVAHLRRAVASTWSIPEDKQVGVRINAIFNGLHIKQNVVPFKCMQGDSNA